MDINAICQSADNQYIGNQLLQFTDKTGAEIFPVVCCMACSYHAYDMQPVEICISFVEQHQRCVITVAQA